MCAHSLLRSTTPERGRLPFVPRSPSGIHVVWGWENLLIQPCGSLLLSLRPVTLRNIKEIRIPDYTSGSVWMINTRYRRYVILWAIRNKPKDVFSLITEESLPYGLVQLVQRVIILP